MLVNVGDTPPLRWRTKDAETERYVDPASVTAVLRAPDGATSSLTVTREALGTHLVTPTLTGPGDWLVIFTSTGPAQRDELAIHAAPQGETPAWGPTLRLVGAHIPSRTRHVSTNEPIGTFSDDTYPTGDQVTGVIGEANAVVAGFVGAPVKEAAYPLCTTAAALWAAYWVEVGWPERDGGSSVYDRLRTDAVYAMERAAEVNVAAGGGTTSPPDEEGDGEGTITGLSSYCFPPVPRYPLYL